MGMDQNQIRQIQMMEQEVNHFNQQMQLIDQNIGDMTELIASLIELESHEGGEMLVNIGKKIYLPVEAKGRGAKLIVEVGKGNLVEKSVEDAKKIVEDQIGKLNAGKIQVSERLEELQAEMVKMMGEIEKARAGESVGGKEN